MEDSVTYPLNQPEVQALLHRPSPHPTLDQLRALAEDSFRAIRAQATVHHYLLDWHQFCAWCHQEQVRAFPASPETVILFATDLTKNEERKVSTIQRKFSAISKLHLHLGVPSPTHTPVTRQFLRILLRSFQRDRKEASKGTEGKGSLGSEAEQLRHEFGFGHHVFLCYPSHSSLANHMHRLDPFQRSSGTGKGFVPFGQPDAFFRNTVILF